MSKSDRAGVPAGQSPGGSGAVHGPEEPDQDPQAGGGKVHQRHPDDVPSTGGDAPSHNSR
jgi:hypothetical protein